MTSSSKGFAPTAIAFVIWGVFPLYFHSLQRVSAVQVIAHRIVWACAFVVGWILLTAELRPLRAALADRRLLGRLAVAAALISLNWFLYVWAVLNGHVIESSLGYFIGPIVNVLLGVVILSERLTGAQWTAVGLAAAGVLYLTIMSGGPPWIALALALSFALYGLIRKVVHVEALPGLAIETLVLMPFAVLYLIRCEWAGVGAFGHAGTSVDALLVGSGPLTAITLFLFAYGARLLPYSTVGILQYIAPTLQFACGVFVLHEPFDRAHAIGFSIIWAALLMYAAEGLRIARRQRQEFAQQGGTT